MKGHMMKKLLIRVGILIFIVSTVMHTLEALEPQKAVTQYNLKKWDMFLGLPSNSIFAIEQTEDGYLWLGTQNGLLRFDGVEFELIDTTIKNDETRALYKDAQGTLWIGTTNEGLFSYKEGTFTQYPVNLCQGLLTIRAITSDAVGNLWIGSASESSGGLTSWSKNGFKTYTTRDGLPDNKIYSIFKDKNHQLWITTPKGIVKMTRPGVFQVNPGWHAYTACAYDYDKRQLWLSTKDKTLIRFQAANTSVFGQAEGFPGKHIYCLFFDHHANLWIGTDDGGLTRFANNQLTGLTVNDGLADNSIYTLFEDREKNLWAGTIKGGLMQLSDPLFTTYSLREGLTDETVQALCFRAPGELLIGTRNGLFVLDKTDPAHIKPFLNTLTQPLANQSVLSLLATPDKVLWIGTFAGLHYVYKNQFVTITKENGLSGNSIDCMLYDRSGRLWAGTPTGLNCIINPSLPQERKIITNQKGFANLSINSLLEDSHHNVLVGTSTGLICFPQGNPEHPEVIRSLTGKNILCLYQGEDKQYWLGTDNGLLLWQGKQSKAICFTSASGLKENMVLSILEDQGHYLWLAGQNGISRLSKKDLLDFAAQKISSLEPDTFDERDGIKSRFCTGPAVLGGDGFLWFSTFKGVVTIDPNHIPLHRPSVLIKKIVVDGASVPLPWGKESKVLDPGIKRIEFYYTAISFQNPQKIRFKVGLQGYDDDWVKRENKRSTTYTNLNPGAYTFHVIADYPGGLSNPPEATLSIRIKPFFHQTIWFYAFLILFILFIILTVHYMRVRHFRENEKKLSHLVEMRTRDLQERNLELEKAEGKIRLAHERIASKNQQLEKQTSQLQEQAEKLKEMDQVKSRFFANISHEFRTPLTLIMGPLEQMLAEADSEQEKKRIFLMQRNSQRLLELINQLLELSKFESGKVKLHVTRQNVISLLKGIIANFLPLTDHHELQLLFQAEEEDITLYIDAEKLDHIIGNLLMNAIKYTPAGGKITIVATRVEDVEAIFPHGLLAITVSDTGSGIPVEQLPLIFNRFYQTESAYEHRLKGTGVGLALVKEFVQIHHGTIDVHSHEGRGTEFIIHFPLGEGYYKPEEIVAVPGLPRSASTFAVIPDMDSDTYTDFTDKTELNESVEHGPAASTIVLIVDDSTDVRSYVRSSLEPLYTVVEARDGEEGLTIAQQQIPDLVISDIMMPRMDGLELCQHLKENIKTSHIPIILLTARAAEENIIRGLETGADDYITKPFNTRILLARIKNLVDLRHQRHVQLDREMTLQPVEIPLNEIDKEFLKKLKNTIHKNLANPEFNVEQLAREFSLDRSTLYRKILALTGETPLDLIHSYRLKRAAEMLRNSSVSVIEVALEVGFSSASYFARCFKKKFLRSPSEVKDKNGAKPV